MTQAQLTPELRSVIRDAISAALSRCRQAGDIELQRSVIDGVTRDERLILRSPDGQRWAITVSNSGVLSAVSV